MEEKSNQAAGSPVPATDHAPKQSSSEAPNAAAEQGVGTAAAQPETNPQDAQQELQSNPTNDVVSDAAQVSGEPGESESAEAGTPENQEVVAEAEPTAAAEATPEAAPTDEGTSDTAEAQANDAPAEPAAETAVAPVVAASSDTEDSTEEITMEDVLAASDEQLARKPIHRGMLTTGEVIMLGKEGIVVDVGAKIEGLLPYNQLFDHEVDAAEAAKYFKPGDTIQVYVVRADIPNNTIILSKKRADQERAWNLLQEIYENQKPVEVEIVEKVRGGLVANLGIRAFLPASQVDIRRVNDLAPYVGQRLKVKIIELNRKRNRVIISRRAILEEEIAEQKAETLKKLEPGVQLEGEVVEITDFGAFVNLGGIDGLVHRSELTHGRFNHPRDVVKVGQKVKVEVLDMDLERERINLSMKRLIANPWEHVLANYHIGQKVKGKVTNLTPFGAFVEIEPGLEGLIHVSEMSWTKRIRHPKEVLSEGDEVEAMILKIDTNQQRISLGLRQTQPDPWSSLPDRYPPGTEITGPITGITDFGVFMEIEEGIEGLVHISELSHDHIEDINEHFSRGDEITAVILNIDPVEQRASLSRKRLLPFSASEYDGGGMPTGAPQARGGRKGRRGGRRGQDIDYDYSYAATDSGGKTTTKLGDVYADLFAQFGLTESKEGAAPAESSATAEAAEPAAEAATAAPATEAPATEAAAEGAAVEEAVTDTAESAAEVAGAEAEPAAEATAEATPQEATEAAVAEAETADEEAVDAENAIDAAEAAALLTAAFREGKRPPKPAAEEAATAEAATEEAAPEEAATGETAAEEATEPSEA